MRPLDLFHPEPESPPRPLQEVLGPSAWLLRGFARDQELALLEAVARVSEDAPFRSFQTPGGRRMSVAMTNSGELGWISDVAGYRYSRTDPASDQPWPVMPEVFRTLARAAAARAGFPSFEPEACLINRYASGTRLALHQDRDERDMSAPIVSVSLGVPATFLWGGATRVSPFTRWRLESGDVVVWGGESRLNFHGVAALEQAQHSLTGEARINLTFRRVGRAGAK